MASRYPVTVAEAATALGVSDKAIRRRLKTGELKGEQRRTPQGFVWVIDLPADVQAPSTRSAAQQEEQAPPAGRQSDHTATVTAGMVAELATAQEAVRRLEAHLGDLRATIERQAEELAERRREAQELRALVGMVTQTVRPLPPPDRVDADQTIDSPDDQTGISPQSAQLGRRSWWRFWV